MHCQNFEEGSSQGHHSFSIPLFSEAGMPCWHLLLIMESRGPCLFPNKALASSKKRMLWLFAACLKIFPSFSRIPLYIWTSPCHIYLIQFHSKAVCHDLSRHGLASSRRSVEDHGYASSIGNLLFKFPLMIDLMMTHHLVTGILKHLPSGMPAAPDHPIGIVPEF